MSPLPEELGAWQPPLSQAAHASWQKEPGDKEGLGVPPGGRGGAALSVGQHSYSRAQGQRAPPSYRPPDSISGKEGSIEKVRV